MSRSPGPLEDVSAPSPCGAGSEQGSSSRLCPGLVDILISPESLADLKFYRRPIFWLVSACGGAILQAVLVIYRTFSRAGWVGPAATVNLLLIGIACLVFIILSRVAICNWFLPPGKLITRLLKQQAARRSAPDSLIAAGKAYELEDYMQVGARLQNQSVHSRLVGRLSASGVKGLAVRASGVAGKLKAPIEPLVVPFEPMLLDESAADLLDLASVSGKDPRAAVSSAADSTDAGRRLRRAWRLGVFGIPVGGLLYVAFNAFVRGAFHPRTLFWIGLFALSCFLRLRRNPLNPNVYIIPGGLIDARGKRVFRRDDCLLVWQLDLGHFHIVTAGGDVIFSPHVTAGEATIALRAWLSPVRAPSDEMLASFLGKDRD